MAPVCPFVQCFPHGDDYRSAISPKDLPPGSIVCTEKPLAMKLLPSVSHQYCANCLFKFNHDKPGKRCLGGCQSTFFCSRDCQRDHFPVHKHTCKKYSAIVGDAVQQYNLKARELPDYQQQTFPFENFLLARNTYIALCQFAGISIRERKFGADLPVPPLFEELYEGNQCCRNASDDILGAAIAHSFGLKERNAASYFAMLLRKFRFNNFGVVNNLQQVIASAIYPRGAILNHSCDPNCILTYRNTEVVIKTIKPVSKGDALFHSYTDICQPTGVRQSHLKDIYSFQCDCDRCEGQDQWPDVEVALTEGNERLGSDDTRLITTLINTASAISTDLEDDVGNVTREYDALRRALSIQRAKLGRYNLERYKTECLALNVSILLGSKEALSHAEATVKFLEYVCNENYPLLLLQKRTLSELRDCSCNNS